MISVKLWKYTLDICVLHLVAPESFDSHHKLVHHNSVLSNGHLHVGLKPLVDTRMPRSELLLQLCQLHIILHHDGLVLLLLLTNNCRESHLVHVLGLAHDAEMLRNLSCLSIDHVEFALTLSDKVLWAERLETSYYFWENPTENLFNSLPLSVENVANSIEELLDVHWHSPLLYYLRHTHMLRHSVRVIAAHWLLRLTVGRLSRSTKHCQRLIHALNRGLKLLQCLRLVYWLLIQTRGYLLQLHQAASIVRVLARHRL